MSTILIDPLGLNQIFRDVANFLATTYDKLIQYIAGIFNDVSGYIASLVNPVLNTIKDFLSGVAGSIGNIVIEAKNAVIGMVQQISGSVFSFLLNIDNALRSVLGDIGAAIGGIANSITTELKRLLAPVADALKTIVDEIKGIGGAIFQAVGDSLKELWREITGFFRESIDAIWAWLAEAFTTIQSFVTNLWREAQALFADAANFLRGIASGVNDFVRTSINELKGFVGGVVASFSSLTKEAIVDLSKVAQVAIDTIVGGSSSLIAGVNDRLAEVKAGFVEAADTVVRGVDDVVTSTFGDVGETIEAISKILFGAADPTEAENVISAIRATVSKDGNDIADRAGWERLLFLVDPKSPFHRLAWTVLFGAGTALAINSGVSSAQAQIMLQEWAVRFHYQLLSPADAAQAYRRGARQLTDVIPTITKQGYSPEDALAIVGNSDAVPAIGDLLAMWLRDELSDDGLKKALFQHGLDAQWAMKLQQLSHVVPPVGDLVTMAVREVFDRQKADALGLYQEFPEEFGKEAKKHGLSREWAERYWAAHWTLPSATQGAEMLQRGQITPDEYDDLLKALDYSPVWRNRLKEIAFNVLTRVDIRRMHKIGVIQDAELVAAYEKIGYDPVDATRLAFFTQQLSAGVSPDDDDELGKLSRASILGFFDDGLITEPRALELLKSIGQTPEAARLYVESVKFENQRAERKAEINLVLELAAAGVATFEEAHDRLQALGLETVEVQNALAKLLRADQKRSKLPTREEALSLFLNNAIKLEDYRDLLTRLGFAKKWSDAFVKVAIEAKNAN